MARCKSLDTNPQFLSVDPTRQLLGPRRGTRTAARARRLAHGGGRLRPTVMRRHDSD